MGSSSDWANSATLSAMCQDLSQLRETGMQIGVVIGGGNILRGVAAEQAGMDRVHGDHIGMIATIINGIVLQQSLSKLGCPSRVMSALGETDVVEAFHHERALAYLEEGKIIFFVGGTGNPFFTTDTCAALRAAQIGADVLLKATKVDGVYDRDPNKDPSAKRFEKLSYREFLDLNLKVMDGAAVSMCRENRIPIKVFSTQSLQRAVSERAFGTSIVD